MFVTQGEDEHTWTPVLVGDFAHGGMEFDARSLNQCKSVKFFTSESGPSSVFIIVSAYFQLQLHAKLDQGYRRALTDPYVVFQYSIATRSLHVAIYSYMKLSIITVIDFMCICIQ